MHGFTPLDALARPFGFNVVSAPIAGRDPVGVHAIIPENDRWARKGRSTRGFMQFGREGRGSSRSTGFRDERHLLAAETAPLMPLGRPGALRPDCPGICSCRRGRAFRAGVAVRSRGRRIGHAQFRQCRHRCGREGGRRDHGPQFRRRPAGQGHGQHHLRAPVPRSLVYPTLLSALRLQGFAAVESDGVVKIVPEADAKQQGGVVASGPVTAGGDRLVTQVITLRFESAAQLVNVLRPLITPNNTIAAYPAPTRSSSPTTPTISSASTGSSRRSISRRAASRRGPAPLRVGARRRHAAESPDCRGARRCGSGHRPDVQQRVTSLLIRARTASWCAPTTRAASRGSGS